MQSAKCMYNLLKRVIVDLFSLIRCLPKKIALMPKLLLCNLLNLNEVHSSISPRYILEYYDFESQIYLTVLFILFSVFFSILYTVVKYNKLSF